MKSQQIARFGLCLSAFLGLTAAPIASPATAQSKPAVVRDSLAGTLVSWEMVQVPGGKVTIDGRSVEVKPFFIGRTEVSWDLYDVYMLRLDKGSSNAAADAIARPSLPYAVPDYDWGHAGYAAISIARNAAQRFAEWLSCEDRAQVPAADRSGMATRRHTRRPGLRRLRASASNALAWHRGNANERRHTRWRRNSRTLLDCTTCSATLPSG